MIALMFAASTAVFWGGNELYSQCVGDRTSQFVCLAYVSGVADGIAVSQLANEPSPYKICIPPNEVDRRQLTDIAIKFLREHPEHRNLHANVLVYRALQQAFPC